MESTPGEDTVKTVVTATKDLEHYINLVDKAAVGCKRSVPNCERWSTMGKMLSNYITMLQRNHS